MAEGSALRHLVATMLVITLAGSSVGCTRETGPDSRVASQADTTAMSSPGAKDPGAVADAAAVADTVDGGIDVGDPSTWWAALPADPRGQVTGALTAGDGHEVLSVGGQIDGGGPAGGAGYDPSTQKWRSIAAPPEDLAAAIAVDPFGIDAGPLSVDVGDDLLFLGGINGETVAWRYRPGRDLWSKAAPPPSTINAGTPTVWTGTELLAWLPTPAPGGEVVAYDPAVDRWTSRQAPAPIGHRRLAASVWADGTWIVWGGETSDGVAQADGARFELATGTWHPMAASPLSARRARGVWTGSALVVLGGTTGGPGGDSVVALADGAAYNPQGDHWYLVPDGPAHPGHLPIWTGRYVALFAKGDVALYDARASVWRNACCNNIGQGFGRPVWTGQQAVVLGSTDRRIGGIAFTPPRSDPPGVSDEVWSAAVAPGVGFDATTAWRLNAVLGLVDGQYRKGLTDVLMVHDRRLSIAGDPAVIEQIRPAIEALGLTIASIEPTDGSPATTAPALLSPATIEMTGPLQLPTDAPAQPFPVATAPLFQTTN